MNLKSHISIPFSLKDSIYLNFLMVNLFIYLFIYFLLISYGGLTRVDRKSGNILLVELVLHVDLPDHIHVTSHGFCRFKVIYKLTCAQVYSNDSEFFGSKNISYYYQIPCNYKFWLLCGSQLPRSGLGTFDEHNLLVGVGKISLQWKN